MNSQRRPPWYLLTGLALGLVLGLGVAWLAAPVEYLDTRPSSLRADFKDDYRALVAAAFVATGDLGRAQARLALLDDPDPARTLAMLAQRTLAEGGSADRARALGLLAAALETGQLPPVVEPGATELLTPGTPEAVDTPAPFLTATVSPTADAFASATPDGNPTERPTRTSTPTPSLTPTPTQGAPFQFQDFSLVCEPNLQPPLIQVYVVDAAGSPVPGVGLQVRWEGGQETFYTGLKPEFGLGYADFAMAEGVVYSLTLAEGGEPVNGLTPAAECPPAGDGSTYSGSWQVNFRQP